MGSSSNRWMVVVVAGLVWCSLLCWTCGHALSVECEECEKSRCPELHYCEGEAVKDHCGCCTVCSSSKYQPHPLIISVQNEANACRQVECPKFKVCVENVHGHPVCTCPSDYSCRSRRKRLKPVCGTDGVTYESRCHMRISACNNAVKIRVARKGPCSGFGLDGVPRPRACQSFSSCRKRQNQHAVCGTDGKSYISRCHMKIVACQQGVKIKVKNAGICPPEVNHAPSSDQWIGTSGVARDNGSASRTRRRDKAAVAAASGGSLRKRKKSSGNDVSGSDDSKAERRRRRREKRKRRKERRRKRRKARGKGKSKSKSRSRRFKLDKNQFLKTFGSITWSK